MKFKRLLWMVTGIIVLSQCIICAHERQWADLNGPLWRELQLAKSERQLVRREVSLDLRLRVAGGDLQMARRFLAGLSDADRVSLIQELAAIRKIGSESF